MQAIPDETDLIHSAMQGDLNAFNILILAHQDRLYRQAWYMLGDAMSAEDAVQDAFISAYKAIQTYRGGSFRGWLMRILTNKCLDELRRRKSHPEANYQPTDVYGEEIESPYWSADPEITPEEHALNSELGSMLLDGLEKLSCQHRTVLVLVDIQGMSYSEAAQILDCPTGTIKSRLARARVHMRRILVTEFGSVEERPINVYC
jgi:RNA polymerase sigma-70 factor (ECF subfamily)